MQLSSMLACMVWQEASAAHQSLLKHLLNRHRMLGMINHLLLVPDVYTSVARYGV